LIGGRVARSRSTRRTQAARRAKDNTRSRCSSHCYAVSWQARNFGAGAKPATATAGNGPSKACACAWLYDTRPLEDLFRGWRPRNREKHNCISFLAHYAWTTSRGEAMNEKDRPGCLRAHKIVSKKRFARPQPWSTPRNMSGCSLRRGARPDAWAV
jgi:hypothetical protein